MNTNIRTVSVHDTLFGRVATTWRSASSHAPLSRGSLTSTIRGSSRQSPTLTSRPAGARLPSTSVSN